MLMLVIFINQGFRFQACVEDQNLEEFDLEMSLFVMSTGCQ